MRKIRVGDVAVAPLPGGGFGACQVSGVLPDTVTIHALDWHGPRPPGLDDLRGAGPATVKRHRVRAEVARTSVSRKHNPMPPDFEWIGNLPVPAGVPDTVDTWSGWRTPLLDTVLEREWVELPEEVLAARRRSRAADPLTIDLGNGPVVVSAGLDDLDLTAWPADRPMDPALLPLLPRCHRLRWSGPDRGLVAALRRHPMITDLTWSDAPEIVDLRETRVRHPAVSGKDCREILLPTGTHSLQLDGADEIRRVQADDDGRWLSLHIVAATPHSVPPSGLAGVRSVSLRGAGVLSAATIAGFTEAHTLRLYWESAPGRLDTPDALAEMTGLRLLEMLDAYGLNVEALPGPPVQTPPRPPLPTPPAPPRQALPSAPPQTPPGPPLQTPPSPPLQTPPGQPLQTPPGQPLQTPPSPPLQTPPGQPLQALPTPPLQTPPSQPLQALPTPPLRTLPGPSLQALVVDGLRKSAARALRARYRGSGVTLMLSGAKSDSWLDVHLDNPFRDWADDDPAAGDAACKAYAAAVQALGTLTAPAGPAAAAAAAAEPILRELVKHLNAVDNKFDIIDTLRREEAGDAFMNLAARAGVPPAQADEWFDTWRDF
ncbi:hypothetical protein [Actinoplanes italicus]|uniref:Uncharacterized protein n=1 Tax=Actinoplanes italicus TaxID=113567 RepID=A0A2T0K2W7_9ACTN|nr:hypothetical protein [Actinoplanes italicus]PRX17175.1 hypothetical protein CLV67_117232 [Actinoplanes italicus]